MESEGQVGSRKLSGEGCSRQKQQEVEGLRGCGGGELGLVVQCDCKWEKEEEEAVEVSGSGSGRAFAYFRVPWPQAHPG